MAAESDDVMSQVRGALMALRRRVDVSAAFLFGSHAEGGADADSDIDLAVFVTGAENWGLRERADLAVLVQREVGNEVELHVFAASALEQPDPASFAAYVQKHGVRVSEAAADRVAEGEGEYSGRDAAP